MEREPLDETQHFTIQDGKYCWTYMMNRLRNTYPLLGMLRISGWVGVAAFLAVYFLRGWTSGRSTIVPLLVGFGITFLPVLFWFLNALIKGKQALFRFEMDDDKIRVIPENQAEKDVIFSAVQSGKIWQRYDTIELHAEGTKVPVYIPEADFTFIRDYILDRIPEDADIRNID